MHNVELTVTIKGKPVKLTEQMWQHFQTKFEKGPGCWEWKSGCDRYGYGIFSVKRWPVKAHRLAFMLHKGEIPAGLFVCHTCDNPKCLNPDHLFLGTAKDNVRDMDSKGRRANISGDAHPSKRHPEKVPRGSSHASAKLTEEKVIEMRRVYALGVLSYAVIGPMFGVSPAIAGRAISRQNWKHVQPQGLDVLK